MNRKKVLLPSFVLVALGAVSPAQGIQKFVDENAGVEMRVPRWLQAVPPKPGDKQVLTQLKGTSESRLKGIDGDVELTLMVVRIERQAGPTTGEEGKEKEGGKEDDPELKSIAESRADALNAGTTLPEFLKRRGYKNELTPNTEYFRKPVTDENGLEFKVYELSGRITGDVSGALIRAFVTETDGELFGLVALGPGATVFENDVERALRSLRRVEPGAAAAADDVYADSALRDLPRRRKVRGELVPGWQAFDTENYILVTNVKSQKTIDNMLTDLEVLRAGFLERFPPIEGADMSAVSTVRLCDGYDDYLRYAGQGMDGTGGYWAFAEEELVLFNPERKVPKLRPWLKDVDPIAVLYHESMHQYFHYSNRQLAPGSWFNEGYGEVFGGADVDRRKREIKAFKTNSFRMKLIRSERKKAGAPDLRMFLIMPQHEFYGPGVLVNYANAWSFCYFIEMERQKPERERNQAWADFSDVYLRNLRAVTERYRAKLPDNAPDDWIMTYAEEIQREAIDEALKTVDRVEMEEAWQKAVMKWR